MNSGSEGRRTAPVLEQVKEHLWRYQVTDNAILQRLLYEGKAKDSAGRNANRWVRAGHLGVMKRGGQNIYFLKSEGPPSPNKIPDRFAIAHFCCNREVKRHLYTGTEFKEQFTEFASKVGPNHNYYYIEAGRLQLGQIFYDNPDGQTPITSCLKVARRALETPGLKEMVDAKQFFFAVLTHTEGAGVRILEDYDLSEYIPFEVHLVPELAVFH